jgi:hypothetical protein
MKYTHDHNGNPLKDMTHSHFYSRIFSKYPWGYFFSHPILVLLVAWNYEMRRRELAPDKWYWADERLFLKTTGNKR